ncbi:MAG: DegT/DnrJ/EryC1/StrS aminotransferase family protein [Planctomycetaceae bacterium]|nr:DegT/DnrJ/EryC1/StrS aminotransferase family protein [Planctomycetaceae bacterium]
MIQPPRIVGGMFGREPVALATVRRTPPFVRAGDLWLVNARSAFMVLAEHLQPKRIWLPAFNCPLVIGALATHASAIRFYDRGEVDWSGGVNAGELVVVLDEFGFPADRELMRDLRSRGAVIVEDAAQALLSPFVGHEADYVVYSFRKFLGVIDGGLLGARRGASLPHITLPEPPGDWLALATQAADERAEFDRVGGERRWFTLFQRAEAEQPRVPCTISEASRDMLWSEIDWPGIAARRRENYRVLLERLADWALYPELPADVVPIGFPLVCDHRDAVRQALFAEEIFPPVHWPLGSSVPAECTAAHRLASRIMTLPCDQRYDATVMQRLATIVEREVAR